MKNISFAFRGCFTIFSLIILATGCAETSSTRARPTVAVFNVAAQEMQLAPETAKKIQDQLNTTMAENDEYEAIAPNKLQQTLHNRKVASSRQCADPTCQMKVSKKLKAQKAVSVLIAKNVSEQCEVIAALYDVKTQQVEYRGRSAYGCTDEEIRQALDYAICQVLAHQAAINAQRAEKEPQPFPMNSCLARAEFLWLEGKFAQFQQNKLPGPAKKLEAQERLMAEQVLQLKSAYDDLGRWNQPRWTAAATCRMGALYDYFATSIYRAYDRMGGSSSKSSATAASNSLKPATKGQQLDAVAEEKAGPMKAKAIELYESCVTQAKEKEVETRFTKEAAQRLEELRRK